LTGFSLDGIIYFSKEDERRSNLIPLDKGLKEGQRFIMVKEKKLHGSS
tara:strand:- start:1996 stop:2139 length:144 start_codon:yes stop_codon:yes gene_type:complete